MRNYLLLLMALCLLPMAMNGQAVQKGKITGTVKTTDGKPAELISVSLKGTTYGAQSNLNGSFSFEAPIGEYTMVVYSINAHRKEFPVSITSGVNHFPDLQILEDQKLLSEIVVTGQFQAQSLRNSVYKTKVISHEKIVEKGAPSLEAILNTEVGIRISNDMALGETQFEMMGMSGRNVKVLIDGVPIVERSGNQQILSQIDINTVERIEIVEGPMSVVYGTDALAGVINIITKKGKPKGNKKRYVTARLQEESIGKEYELGTGEGIHVQGLAGGYNFTNGLYTSLNFLHNEYGGWQGNHTQRAREWPSKEQYLLGAQLGLSKTKYSFHYKLDFLDEEIYKKGNISAVNKAVDEKFLATRYTHQIHGNWDVHRRLKLNLAGSFQEYERDKRNTVFDFVSGEKYPSDASDANDDTKYSSWFARATAVWKALHNMDVQAGVEYQKDKGQGDKVSSQAAINNTALFLSVEYRPYEWMNIRPGLRSSFNSEYDAPLAIPSLNLKFSLHRDMDLRLSYAKGFRSPTLTELYYEMYHTNGGGFWIKGNKDLKAEKSNSYMASYVWRILHDEKIRLSSTLSGFYNQFKNQINLINSATVSNDQTYYNIDKYKTQGLSVENALSWNKLTAELAFSYIGRYNRLYEAEQYQAEKQDKMKYSPELSASLAYHWSKIAKISLFYKYTGKKDEYKEYRDASNNTHLALGTRSGYHWADLTLSRPILQSLTATAGIRNIFNVERINNTTSVGGNAVAATTQTLLASGRSYFVGLTFNFTK